MSGSGTIWYQRLFSWFQIHALYSSCVPYQYCSESVLHRCRLVSGGFDYTLKLRDVVTGRKLRTFTGHHDRVTRVAFSPDCKRRSKNVAPGGLKTGRCAEKKRTGMAVSVRSGGGVIGYFDRLLLLLERFARRPFASFRR